MAQPTPYSNLPTPEQIAYQRKLGTGMMEKGMDASPVGHWTQGLARVLQGGVGGWRTSQADSMEKDRTSGLMEALRGSSAFKGLGDADLALMGSDPDLMRATASKVYGNRLDPQAGERAKLLQAELALKQDALAFNREMRPEELALKRAQVAAAGQGAVKEVNGKLVRQGPNGVWEVAYDGGPNLNNIPEYAAKASGFASRMIDAERNVRPIVAGRAEAPPDTKTGLRPLSLIDPNTGRAKDNFDPTANETWLLEKMPEKVANMTVRGGQYQQYRQGAEQWIRSFLRKESGAAIAKDEFVRDFFVYFPQPGDTPETVKQKERAREEVMRSFTGETRGFFDHVNPKGAQQLKEWEQRQTSGPTSPTTVVPNPVAAAPPQPVQQQPRSPMGPVEQSLAPPLPVQQRYGPQPAPPQAVQFLIQNPTPEMMRAFDEKYGPGASKQALRQP